MSYLILCLDMTNYTYAAGDPQPARIPGLTAEVPPAAGEASTVS